MANVDTDLHIELHVPDFKKAIDFYTLLGFKVFVEVDEKYFVMRRGKTYLNFYGGSDTVYDHSYFKNFSKDTKRGYGIELIIPVDDVESFFESVKDKVKVVEPLKLRSWGAKDFRVEDPFGFYLRVTERYTWIKK